MTPEEMVSRLLYRDGLMLVIDKPAGLPVHRGPKGGGSLEDHFDALRFGLPRAPALAHRLDRETSGCLVLGRHRKALEQLGKLFKDGRVGKTYWAVVEGAPDADEGRIELSLGRRDKTRGWWMKVDPSGLPSVTRWTVMGCSKVSSTSPLVGEVAAEGSGRRVKQHAQTFSDDPPPQPSPTRGEGACPARINSAETNLTWLALEPLTGRTHQLRVHCAAMGWPILGDSIYGRAPREGGPRLHLHARQIVVPLSRNKPPVAVTAPVPAHMREMLTACGWDGVEPAQSPGLSIVMPREGGASSHH
jgi:tRNA pseudouridine32 synthase/23S rRNA pseudouridine746 synthase